MAHDSTKALTSDNGPFLVSDAIEAGLSVRQVSGRKLFIPTPGVRSARELVDVCDRATAYALVLPDDVAFSHLTAARLWGLPLPAHLNTEANLEVTRRTGKARIIRDGITCRRGLERRTVEIAHGLRVTSIADTWCDLIETYHRRLSLTDAVVLGDAAVELMHRTRPRIDDMGRLVFDVPEVHPQSVPGTSEWWNEPVSEGIWSLVMRRIEHGQAPGKELSTAALRLLRPRVWSPMETRSRLVIVDGGIREPHLNASVRDSRGRVIVIGDHVWEEEEAVGDYNGLDAHEGDLARVTDNGRRLRLEDEKWWFIEIYRDDVMTRQGRHDLVRRIREGLARRQGGGH